MQTTEQVLSFARDAMREGFAVETISTDRIRRGYVVSVQGNIIALDCGAFVNAQMVDLAPVR